MNPQKIDLVQKQNAGSFDCYSGRGLFSQQPWKMGVCFQPNDQLPASEGGSTKQMINLGSTPNMTTAIAGHFGSPAASSFYATELYMGFPECDSYPAESLTSSVQSSKSDPAGSQLKDTQNFPSSENLSSFRTPYGKSPLCDILFIKSEVGNAQPYRILDHNQTVSYLLVLLVWSLLPVYCLLIYIRTCEWTVIQIEPSSRFQLRRQPANNSTHNTSPVSSNKTRIRWTQDLHKRFVESVYRLGGAESENLICINNH